MASCSKIPFETRAAAKEFLRDPRTQFPGKLHPYMCPHCGSWHLTSQARKQTRRHQRRKRRHA